MKEQRPFSLGDYVDVLRRRWLWLATIIPGAIMLAVYLAYTLPPMYGSFGTIMLERASVPEDMIRTTVESYANQQIELVRRRVMTNESLRELVEARDPYPQEHELSVGEKARLIAQNTRIERVDPVTLQPMPTSTAFSIHYSNPDPELAQYVAQELIDMFLDYNRRVRSERAADAQEFLRIQSHELRNEILAMEQEIADFKARYAQMLPEEQTRNQAALERAERELDTLERQIRTAEERGALLSVQLSQLSPMLFDTSGDWRMELAALRAELAEAQQRYTADHPDVRRLRRSLDALNARVAAMDPAERIPEPDNPDYINVASQLDTTQRDLVALRETATRTRARMRQLEERQVMAPEVERQYLQLVRDYDIAQNHFRTLQTNLADASMATTLETEERGERFTLIRYPLVPSAPESPNRLGMMLLGIMLGGTLSVGMAAVRETSDPTLRSARDLRDFTDIQPIGAIPTIVNRADRRRQIVAWTAGSLVFALGLALVTSTVARAAGPLF